MTVVCIAGMHRSGTSMVARLLNLSGLYLGEEQDLVSAAPDNPDGFWEHAQITKLNDQILATFGGAWDLPPSLPANWPASRKLDHQRETALQLIAKLGGHGAWGWKDPRNSLTLPFWREVIPDLKVAVVIRNPLDIWMSLAKRGYASMGFSTSLTQRYYADLRSSLDPDRYIVTHYDAFFADPASELRRLVQFAGLTPTADVLETTAAQVKVGLRHAHSTVDDLLRSEAPRYLIEQYLEFCREAGPTYGQILAAEFNEDAFPTPASGRRRPPVADASKAPAVEDELVNLRDLVWRRESEISQLKQVITAQQTEREETVRMISAQLAKKDEDLASLEAAKAAEIERLQAVRAAEIEELQAARAAEIDKVRSEKDQTIRAMQGTLEAIYSSRSWRMIARAQKVRLFLIPHGSLPERAIRKVVRGFRKVRSGLAAIFARLDRRFSDNPVAAASAARLKRMALERSAKEVASKYAGPLPATPTASIIIPAYNHIELTLACLRSIAASGDKTGHEVIILDDCSTDATPRYLAKVKGLIYIRNPRNLGFLKSCNEAAKVAKGKYLVFLNNDTEVRPGWLDQLLETFSLFPDAGLVGSKLVLRDGTLQEAGSLVSSDGEAMNYGRGDDPLHFQYNYVCETDYVSGASIALSRQLWNHLGGFDQKFEPAYYEDVDLAFKVRDAGCKVLYQPFSVVTHVEGGSHGVDATIGIKRYQVINRQRLLEKWRAELAGHGSPTRFGQPVERDRNQGRRILYVDDGPPKPDQYAGGLLSHFYITMLRRAGYSVTFLPLIDLRHGGPYTEALQKRGIECVYAPYVSSARQYVQQNGGRFDYVVLSRANVASELLDTVKQFAPQAKLVFNTIDLHFLRFQRAAEVSGKREDVRKAESSRNEELRVIREAACTLVVSPAEKQLLAPLTPDARIRIVPFPADVYPVEGSFEERTDIVFLGGFGHEPNVDAVVYFAAEIWPLISAQLPPARFVIAGPSAPPQVSRLSSDTILVRGLVEDLPKLFAKAKMSVAPLRFGAGIKGKILTSLGYGVPCVASSIAAEGMGLADGLTILVADGPQEFCDAVVKLYNSPDLWSSLSQRGQAWIQETYSREVVAARLIDVFREI